MILFLFVIMMVQIHLMPVTTSIAPRIQDAKSSVSALDNLSSHPSNLAMDLAVNTTPLRTAMVEGSLSGTLGLSDNQDGHLSVRRTNQGVYTRILSFQVLQIPLFSQYIFNLINPQTTGYGGGNMIVNYFFPSWFVEFKTMTDLETLANILYLGYPTAQLLIGVALWAVLIGIIKVTASKA